MKNKLMAKLTILLIGFAVMGDMVVIPAVGGIFGSFPDADPMFISLFLTGPLFFTLIGSILCGIMARYISKKYLLIGSYLLFIVAACGGALVDNMTYIVTMRLLVGLTYGFTPTAAMGLIAEVFSEEKERSTMMGSYNASTAVWGVLMSLAGGYLAVSDWHLSYYVYLVSIPILVTIFAFVPKTPPEGKQSPDGAEAAKERLPYGKFIPIALAFLFINIFYSVIMYYIAIYVEETGLGDASVAGVMSSAGTVGIFLAGLLFSVIYLRVKRGTPIIFFLVMAAAYIIMAFPTNVWVVGIMCVLAGGAFGLNISYYYMHVSMIVPPGVMSLAMGILGAALSIGGFLSSYALMGYQAALGVSTIAPTFLYIGLSLGVCGVISIILTARAGKNLAASETGA